MSAKVPTSFLEDLDRPLTPGEWYPIHQLLTSSASTPPAVCLLSAAEIRATVSTVTVVSRSSTAATNLSAHGHATLLVWSEGLHYLTLDLQTHREREGSHGYLFDVIAVRTDDIGIEIRPQQYQMTEWLAAAERWDLTKALVEELSRTS